MGNSIVTCTERLWVIFQPSDGDNNNIELETTEEIKCVLLQCNVCQENYSDDRLPRNLTCGHSLCNECADKCLASKKICPECLESQSASTGSDLPINYPLLSVRRHVARGRIYKTEASVPTVPDEIPCIDPVKGVWKCSSHNSPILFLCCVCNTWICQDCLVIEHPILPRGTCRILGLKDAAKHIQRTHESLADKILSAIKDMEKSLEFDLDLPEFFLEEIYNDLGNRRQLLYEILEQLYAQNKNSQSVADRGRRRVNSSANMLKTIDSPEFLTMTCNGFKDFYDEFKEFIKWEMEKFSPIMQDILKHLRVDLKLLVRKRDRVYAIHKDAWGSSWAAITIRKNRLLLHSLNEGEPPKGGVNIPYEYVKKLILKQNVTIFLGIGHNEGEDMIGVVYVQLEGDRKEDEFLTQRTLLWCTGEGGKSYKNATFYDCNTERGILCGGIVHNNANTGSTTVNNPHTRKYSFPTVKGNFAVDVNSTRFQIHLKYLHEPIINCIGRAMKGSDGLAILSDTEKALSLKIVDCGIFIQMETP